MLVAVLRPPSTTTMRSRTLAFGLRFGLGLGFGGFLAVAYPLSASAQPAVVAYPAPCAATSVPPAKSDDAHAFYGAGRALYDEGNYDAAIAQFLAGELTKEQAMQQMFDGWQALTDQIGRDAQAAAYAASIGAR